ELPALLSLVDIAAEHGLDDHAWRIASLLATFLNLGGRWDDTAAVQGTALAAARRSGNLNAQGRALRSLAQAATRPGGYAQAEAYLHEARALFRWAGNRIGEGYAQLDYARILGRLDRRPEAIALLRAGLARWDAQPHTVLADGLNMLSWL